MSRFVFVCVKITILLTSVYLAACSSSIIPIKPAMKDLYLVSSAPDPRYLAGSAYCLNFNKTDAPSVTQCPVHFSELMIPQFDDGDMPTGELPEQEHDWSVFDANASYLQLVKGSVLIGAEYIITRNLDYKIDPTALDDETLDAIESYCAGENSVHAVVESVDLGCSIRVAEAGVSGLFPKYSASLLINSGHQIGASSKWWAQGGSSSKKSSCTQSRVVRVKAIPLQTFCDRHVRFEKYARLRRQVAELRRTVDKITYESAETRVKKQVLEERVAKYEKEIHKTSSKLEEYRHISRELAQKIESMQAKNYSNLELINNLKHDVDEKNRQLSKLSDEKKELNSQLSALKAELSEVHKNTEVNMLKTKLADIEKKLLANKQDIDALMKVIKKQENTVTELKKDIKLQ